MRRTIVKREIHAPAERVFQTISEIENFPKSIPEIVKVEIVSQVRSGVGTRFKETRLMHGREATTELEVSECVPNERIRIVGDAQGTVWDSVFSLQRAGEKTLLELTLDARPYRLLAKITAPLFGGIIRKALERDLDAVKAYCERV